MDESESASVIMELQERISTLEAANAAWKHYRDECRRRAIAALERIENAAIEKGAEALPYIVAEAQTVLELSGFHDSAEVVPFKKVG